MTEPLMFIAQNHDLRIYERIIKIKGEDKKISSRAEAEAIISIPSVDLVFTDSKEALSLAKMEAYNYLKNGGKNLVDDLVDAYNYCREKGSVIFGRISRYLVSEYMCAQTK